MLIIKRNFVLAFMYAHEHVTLHTFIIGERAKRARYYQV